MARPQKEGLDYFSLDVDMDQDDKVLLIEAKHKITGFAVLLKLLMKVYKEGYYYKWTEREQLLFSSRINVDTTTVTEVVNDCIKWEIFNHSLYDKYSILTSRGIQKRYIEAIKRRKEITLILDYLVVDPPEQTDSFTVNLVNVDRNLVNVDINPTEEELMSTLIPKVKKTKLNNNKEPIVDFFELIWKLYPKKEGKGQVSKSQKDKLFKIGLDEMTRAINRYIQAKKGTSKQYLQNGSTFFNSGYIDYLDENYTGGQAYGHEGSKGISSQDGGEVKKPKYQVENIYENL
jgi:hypothetical protein